MCEDLKDHMVNIEEKSVTFETEDEKKIYGMVQRCVDQLWSGHEGKDSTVWWKLDITEDEAEKRIRENVRP